MQQDGAWPRKTRELHNHHMDSTIWNRFAFRPDDIVISTYAKAGTTWTQQIVGQLVFAGDPEIKVAEISPWLDLRVPSEAEKFALLEAQTHRRFIKTHQPLDAFVFRPEIKHIYVARDGRDVAWSLYNHYANFMPELIEMFNTVPGLVGPKLEPAPEDVLTFYRAWMEGDGYPFWSMWDNVRTWWQVRHFPNVLMLHYADMKADLPGTVRKITAFLEIELDEAIFETVVRHSSFDWMKANAEKAAPLGGMPWQGGAKTFVNKGTNGRWREVLTEADIAVYEARALAELGPECARWLAEGGPIMPAIAAA